MGQNETDLREMGWARGSWIEKIYMGKQIDTDRVRCVMKCLK